jgi:hypothetical protein
MRWCPILSGDRRQGKQPHLTADRRAAALMGREFLNPYLTYPEP